ncbi:myelin-associated glycoprotein-like isoform 2-T3 [Pholidichthys leucotaenia]
MFDSGKNSNRLQGSLTGNLLEKNCTTILNNMPVSRYDYFFRLQCDNSLKFNFNPPTVSINIRDSLPAPTITPSQLEVEEGSPVTLTCSAVAPCPILPPLVTWIPSIGDPEESAEDTKVTSVMNFTASHLHNGQNFSCSALYRREAGNNNLTFQGSLILQVLYPPNNTTISHPGAVTEGSSVTLTCNTNANPNVNYTWYKVVGEQETEVGSEKLFSTTASEIDNQFYCKVSNKYGTQNSSVLQIDVQFSPKGTTVIVDPKGPILAGTSVSLLCSSRSNPPVTNYTWYRDDEEARELRQMLVIDPVDPSHSGDYYCAAKNDLGEENSTTIQLDVEFVPKILPSSHCVQLSFLSKCTCNSHGNPLPSLVWELGGKPVNHSADIPVWEVTQGVKNVQSTITLYRLDEDIPSVICVSISSLGSDRMVFDVSFNEIYRGLDAVSLVIGCAVGVGIMLLVCLPLSFLYWMKKGIHSVEKGPKDTSESLVTNEINSSQMDVIYTNKAILEKEGKERTDDTIIYANVDFAKLQAKSDGHLREGEIRGVTSKTDEYAEIRLHRRGSNKEEAKNEETRADVAFEQGKLT